MASPEYVPVSDEEERRIFESLARMYENIHFDPLTPAQQARCMASIAKYNSPETLEAVHKMLGDFTSTAAFGRFDKALWKE